MRADWSSWEPWGNLWAEWTRLRQGERNIALEHIQFIDLYNFFVRQVKALGKDPYSINVSMLIDPSLTYAENRTILASVTEHPLTEEEEEKIRSASLEAKLEELKKRSKRVRELDEKLKASS